MLIDETSFFSCLIVSRVFKTFILGNDTSPQQYVQHFMWFSVNLQCFGIYVFIQGLHLACHRFKSIKGLYFPRGFHYRLVTLEIKAPPKCLSSPPPIFLIRQYCAFDKSQFCFLLILVCCNSHVKKNLFPQFLKYFWQINKEIVFYNPVWSNPYSIHYVISK